MQKFFLIISFILVVGSSVMGEGTKELNVNGQFSTGLFICTDLANHCINAGHRSNFATYDAPTDERLYFQVANPGELVYLGFKGGNVSGTPARRIVFRIKDQTGNIVVPEQNLPTSGTGYISTLSQAINGPIQLNGPAGYDALVFTPLSQGLYFIEFSMKLNSNNQIYIGYFYIDMFDITIGEATAGSAKPGRLYSKSWQFSENGNFFGTNYILTDDGIVFSAAFNNMDAAIWTQASNQYGCVNTGNWLNDRKSRMGNYTLPQFRIFLNNPDPLVFPVNPVLGQFLPPGITGIHNCATGEILFQFNVNTSGTVQMYLNFGGTYQPRILNQQVVSGFNVILWDGNDGSSPGGIPVANNTIINYNCEFINGLTNMPLFDVEKNTNGFTINQVNPPSTTLAVYWDDTNIPPGTYNALPPGCISPPGCHSWYGYPAGFGDNNTLNTWWYNVSSTTQPIQTAEFRMPQVLALSQPFPAAVCPNNTGFAVSVVPDPNTEIYHWSYNPPAGVSITQVSPSDNQISLSFGPGSSSGTLSVYGTNTNCPSPGPTLVVPVAVEPGGPPQAAGAIMGNPYPVTGLSGVVYSIDSIPLATSYLWQLPPGATIASGAGTKQITVDFGTNAVSGPITVAGVNNCGTGPASASLLLTVNAYDILASFTFDSTACSYDTVHFYPFTPAEGIVQEVWDYGDGTSQTFSQPAQFPVYPRHKFPLAGMYLVTRTVTYINNHVESSEKMVEPKSPPLANFVVSSNGIPSNFSGCPGQVLLFTDISYPGSSGPFGQIVSWRWDFGDGSPLVFNQNFNHIYSDPGIYNVSLTVGNYYGCSDSITIPVTIHPLPEPTISGPISACAGAQNLVYFTESGMNNYLWSVSSGGVITSGWGTQSISVNWNNPGAQMVFVSYIDLTGCQSAAPSTLSVAVSSDLPVSIIVDSPVDSVCNGDTVVFTTVVTNGGDLPVYQWFVNSTDVAGATNSTFGYVPSGSDVFSCMVSSNHPCSTGNPAFSNQIGVSTVPLPKPEISGPLTACVNSTGHLYSTEPFMTGYQWMINGGTITGGGSTSASTATVTWTSVGTKTISVNYTNAQGCDATAPATLPVNVTDGIAPGQPLPINGPAYIAYGQTNVVYAVSPVSAATGYVWQLPPGAGIIAGANTNTITVNFAANATSGTVSVYGTNSCGNGPSSNALNVTVGPTVLQVISINNLLVSNGMNLCYNALEVIYVAGENSYFEVQPGGTITLISGARIVILPSAKVNPGGYFHAFITTDNQYCAALQPDLMSLTKTNEEHTPETGIHGIRVYPNPTTGTFTVEFTGKISQESKHFDIYNAHGTKLLSEELTGSPKYEFSLIDQPEGLYMLRITVGNRTETIKMIKQ